MKLITPSILKCPKIYDAPSAQGRISSKLHVQEFLPPRMKFNEVPSTAAKRALALGVHEVFMDEAFYESGFML